MDSDKALCFNSAYLLSRGGGSYEPLEPPLATGVRVLQFFFQQWYSLSRSVPAYFLSCPRNFNHCPEVFFLLCSLNFNHCPEVFFPFYVTVMLIIVLICYYFYVYFYMSFMFPPGISCGYS